MEKSLKSAGETSLLKTLVLFFVYLLMVVITNSLFGNVSPLSLDQKFTFHKVILSLSMGFSYFILTFGFLHFLIQLFEKTISSRETFSFLVYALCLPYILLQTILFSILPKIAIFSNPAQIFGFFQGLCSSIIGFMLFHWLKQRLLFSTRQTMTIILFVAVAFLGMKLFFENFQGIPFSFFSNLI